VDITKRRRHTWLYDNFCVEFVRIKILLDTGIKKKRD